MIDRPWVCCNQRVRVLESQVSSELGRRAQSNGLHQPAKVNLILYVGPSLSAHAVYLVPVSASKISFSWPHTQEAAEGTGNPGRSLRRRHHGRTRANKKAATQKDRRTVNMSEVRGGTEATICTRALSKVTTFPSSSTDHGC